MAARDRLGTYPLFYSDAERRLIASNSIDALLRQPGVSGAVDLPVVRRPRPPCLAVRRGDLLRGGSPRSSREPARPGMPTDPDPPLLGSHAPRAIDWVQPAELERVRRSLRAGRAAMPGARPAGIFLSGGLDSVSVAAVAATTAQASGDPEPLGRSRSCFPIPSATRRMCNEPSRVSSASSDHARMGSGGRIVGPAARGSRTERGGAGSTAQSLDARVRSPRHGRPGTRLRHDLDRRRRR